MNPQLSRSQSKRIEAQKGGKKKYRPDYLNTDLTIEDGQVVPTTKPTKKFAQLFQKAPPTAE